MTKARKASNQYDVLRCADCRSRVEERQEPGMTKILVWHSITCPVWRDSAPEIALALVGATPTTPKGNGS